MSRAQWKLCMEIIDNFNISLTLEVANPQRLEVDNSQRLGNFISVYRRSVKPLAIIFI